MTAGRITKRPLNTLRGVLHTSSPRVGTELGRLQRDMTAPLPLRRRIGVLTTHGGSGATTLAAEMAEVLSSRRSSPVLHIDAQAYEVFTETRHGASPLESHTPGDFDSWWERFGTAQRRHEITITDWGHIPVERLTAIAEHSHAVCLTVPAERSAIIHAHGVALALQQFTPTVMVVQDIHNTAPRSIRLLIKALGVPTVRVPHEPRAQLTVQSPRPKRRSYALAIQRVTARVVRAVDASPLHPTSVTAENQ